MSLEILNALSFVSIGEADDFLVGEAVGAVSDSLKSSGATREKIHQRLLRVRAGEMLPTTEFLVFNGVGAGWLGMVPHSSGNSHWWESTTYLAPHLRGKGLFPHLMGKQQEIARRIKASTPEAVFLSSIDSLNQASLKSHLKFVQDNCWAATWHMGAIWFVRGFPVCFGGPRSSDFLRNEKRA